MAYKLDIRDIIKAHLKTIVNDSTGKPDGRDYIVFLLLPSIITFILLYYKVFLNSSYIDSIISGLSIYVGLSLNLVVLLFEIVQKQGTSDFKKGFARDIIANISFSIILSIVTILMSLLTQIKCHNKNSVCILEYVTNGITFFLIIQMILVIILLVRNMYFQILEQID